MSTDMYLALGESGRQLEPKQPVGFDHLPNQLVDYKIKQGFSFNIMCVGETGCGKSSFLDTLFDKQLHLSADDAEDSDHVLLNHSKFMANEGPVRLTMKISESANYGDFMDKKEVATVFVDYVKLQLKEYFTKKQIIHRNVKSMSDNRVHVCFYMIPSSCGRMKLVDIITMKTLSEYVNIIPIITKCDSLTKEELVTFKSHIKEQITTNDIKIYKFPTNDPATSERNSQMNNMMPFGVISANAVETVEGRPMRVRKLQWGMVKIDDPSHCDVSHLKEMVFRTNMDDIISSTSKVFYRKYKVSAFAEDDVDNVRLSFANKQIKRRSGIEICKTDSKEESIRSAFNTKMTLLQNKHKEQLSLMEKDFEDKTHEIKAKLNALHAANESSASQDKKTKKKK